VRLVVLEKLGGAIVVGDYPATALNAVLSEYLG
jgi:hypothetical protein